MSDLISRQDAIMAVKTGALSAATIYGRTDEGSTALYETVRAIKALPSAQPECKRECMPMYADVSDTISRRAALEAMDTWDKFGCDPDGKLVRYDDDKHYVPYVHYEDMVHAIKHLLSAQPEIVRCKDCKHYQFADNRAFGMPVKMCEWFGFEDVDDDDFCSRAERRQDE